MKLKRINNEKIEKALQTVFGNIPILTMAKQEDRAIAQAQLDDDKEKYEAREIEWIKALMKEGIQVAGPKGLLGARKKIEEAVAQKLFAEIGDKATFVLAEPDKVLLKFINQPNALILAIKDWQALKQEYDVEVEDGKDTTSQDKG